LPPAAARTRCQRCRAVVWSAGGGGSDGDGMGRVWGGSGAATSTGEGQKAGLQRGDTRSASRLTRVFTVQPLARDALASRSARRWDRKVVLPARRMQITACTLAPDPRGDHMPPGVRLEREGHGVAEHLTDRLDKLVFLCDWFPPKRSPAATGLGWIDEGVR
jgi:hypothetical protein